MGLVRKLEAEVMDTERDAIEYDEMDFTEANEAFAIRALELLPAGGSILDLGTGTGRIPLLMMAHRHDIQLRIDAVDLSNEMLKIARRNVAESGFDEDIRLILADVKDLPYGEGTYDMVISNSLIHHIPSPKEVFEEIRRVLKPDGAFLIRDLMRPESMADLEKLVDQYTEGASGFQKGLFRDSLNAALTISEVETIVKGTGLGGVAVEAVSDRHWSGERSAQ